MSSDRSRNFLDRAIQASLLLLAVSAPISIAATQTAWALALLFWLVRLVLVRPRLRTGWMDLAIIAFVGLSLVSAAFSYEPETSLRKMVAVSLVTIFWLSAHFIKGPKFLRAMVVMLLAGAFASCLFTFATLASGKNLKVVRLAADSPLRTAGVKEGVTILRANGIDVASPDALIAAVSTGSPDGIAALTIYDHELLYPVKIPSASLGSVEALGILEWSRGRDTRAAGFYGHYTTFAEALQLIASLAIGLIVAGAGALRRERIMLVIALAAFGAALFLSVTRASWLALAVSATVIVMIGASRRTVLICAALAIPLIIGGLVFLQQKRAVGFLDPSDMSTTWRTTVWREGARLLFSDPRHVAVGVGMDSIKHRYREWHLFDDGRLPIGHMHSDYLQIALERGIPAFLVWCIWLAIYVRKLWRAIRSVSAPFEKGLLLGALGGAIGFLISGLVHYNWGDSEVVMIFYLIMGLSLAALDLPKPEDAHAV